LDKGSASGGGKGAATVPALQRDRNAAAAPALAGTCPAEAGTISRLAPVTIRGVRLDLRSRRSVLYVPASNAKAIDKARTLPCDAVIIDLEDAVAPEAKHTAREQCAQAVRSGGFGGRELIVRINGRDSEWAQADAAMLRGCRLDAVLVPKVAEGADLAAYRALLGADARAPLWAMIETALSVMRLAEIGAAAAAARLECLVLGTNDLARELGAQVGVERAPLQAALALSVCAARAFGLSVLDGVYNALEDDAGFALQCRQAVDFGFDGKTLIHPRQVEPCNLAFTPDAAQIAWAERLVAAFEGPGAEQRGAIRIDGRMVERLHLVEARRTLARARRA
jgi:citrate lyase subunit beta/citryl-CoA lyase